MRWLVFFLVVLNGLVFAWFSFQQQQQSQLEIQHDEAFDFSSVQPLQLLSELPKGELSRRDTRNVIRPMVTYDVDMLNGSEPASVDMTDAADIEPVASSGICAMLGSFPEVISARQVRMDLEQRGMQVKVIEQVRHLPAINWVYIPPLPDRKQALAVLKQLQDQNVDSFLIAEGDYANAISLGFFSTEKAARSVLSQRSAQGYRVEMTLRVRERKSFWVALDEASARLVDAELLAGLGSSRREIKKQEISCAELALLPAIL